LSDRLLLLVALVALAFFLSNVFLHGKDVADDPAFQTRSERALFVLSAALALSAVLHARNAWREGFKRKELPPNQGSSLVKERSFQTEGPGKALIQHCTTQFERFFRRFYAFHRYHPPYVVYFYYAKRGSFSLAGGVFMRTGFLLFFLVCTLSRQGLPALKVWELLVLGLGCLFVISGLLIHLTVSHQQVWLRIIEENNGVFLTLSCLGDRNCRGFEELYHALTRHDVQAEAVSCSTHSR
jgi:hypothetical protein